MIRRKITLADLRKTGKNDFQVISLKNSTQYLVDEYLSTSQVDLIILLEWEVTIKKREPK